MRRGRGQRAVPRKFEKGKEAAWKYFI